MKKIFMLFLLVPTVAFAVNIDANTQRKWNSLVVVAALHDAGLYGNGYKYHADVVQTYNDIVENLLKRKTFSVKDAVSVCVQQCNKSAFLKEGRGQSGRKCPSICKDFGDALITESNKNVKYMYLGDLFGYHPQGRIYSGKDGTGDFYANKSTPVTIQGNKNRTGQPLSCEYAVFESKTNKKIAVCDSMGGEDGVFSMYFKSIDSNYKNYNFILECSYSMLSDDEGRCSLQVESPEQAYRGLYRSLFGYGGAPDTLRELDFSELEKVMRHPLLNKTAYNELQFLYDERDYIKGFSKFTEDSVEMYDELRARQERLSDFTHAAGTWKNTRRMVEIMDALFKNVDHFATIRVKNNSEVTQKVRDAVNKKIYNISDYFNINRITCGGECDHNWITRDEVTCFVGPMIIATFKFADICAK